MKNINRPQCKICCSSLSRNSLTLTEVWVQTSSNVSERLMALTYKCDHCCFSIMSNSLKFISYGSHARPK